MSDELLEAETAPVPVTKSRRPSSATIIGLALLLVALGLGIYVGSFWQQHNSRLARLKAKNGDYVQFEHRGDIDEFAPPQQRQGRRGRGGDGEDGGEEGGGEDQEGGGGDNLAKREVKEPAWYDKYVEEMFPKPVHVVYWRDPSLTADDVKMLLEFKDLEILSINCDTIDSDAIAKFLALPQLRRLNIQAKKLGIDGIESWKPDSKFRTLSLINPSWKGEDIEALYKKAEGNSALKDKLNATSSARPSFGGV